MFAVGQKIVCVNNTPRDNRPESLQVLSLLKVDETYTVKELLDPEGRAISIVEISTPYSPKTGREMGFKSDRFVPLDSYSFADETLARISEEIEEEFLIKVGLPNL